jgi:hypothetical protein
MNELAKQVENIPDVIGEWLTQLPSRHDFEHRVDEILPNGYPVYLRLFHPFLPWVALEPPRVSWRELATRAGVAYGPTLTWRQLEPVLRDENGGRPFLVESGQLDDVTAVHLFTVLAAATGSATIFYRYELGALIALNETFAFKSEGLASPDALRAAVRETAGEHLRGPEWIWPENRAWVVHSDYDLESTYIAAHDGLAAALLADSGLEVLRVSLDTRVDDRADEEADLS